jgi:hydroxypyruvate reductase
MLKYRDHLAHLKSIRSAAMAVADPDALIRRKLSLCDDALQIDDLTIRRNSIDRFFLVAFGKASPAMSRAVVRILDRPFAEGLIAAPKEFEGPLPRGLQVFQTGHPLPDQGSLDAGRAVAVMLADTAADDLVLALISGGGSAMLELPRPGIDLEDIRRINSLMLKSGAPIESINVVRRAISRIKAGGLARMAAPARVVSLILSDVIDDRLSAIASGPTVLRAPTPEQARAILEQYHLWSRIPESIQRTLRQSRKSLPRTSPPKNIVIGNNRLVVHAAREKARELGFPTRVLTQRLEGEARSAGRRMANSLLRTSGPACLLAGGETTVDIRGDGRGGRNQELALAAALKLEGTPGCAVMALATDGVDGPTPGAGAIVTGDSIPRARRLGLDPEGALGNNDSFPFHEALGSLLITGPSGTNLNDLVVGLKYTSA